MKKNKFKKIFGLILMQSVLLTMNMVVNAASGESTGNAGSVSVVARTGFNGCNVYANFNTSDYVDAVVTGVCKFVAVSGAGDENFKGNFEQRTYGAVEINYPQAAIFVGTTFKIVSNNGSWTNSVYAGNSEG